jgi:hypothetical protein
VNDLIRLVLDSIAYLWPFRVVYEGERLLLENDGPGTQVRPALRHRDQHRRPGAGGVRHPFAEHHPQGRTLAPFSATFTVEVQHLGAGYSKVMSWGESARELASAILAQKLAEVGSEMLEPEKRGRLIAGCLSRLRSEPFGLRVTTLRFNNFVAARVYRVFQDAR